MKRLAQLRNREAAIVKNLRGLSDKLATEERVKFNDEEQKQFDSLNAELSEVKSSIAVEEAIIAEEKKLAALPGNVIPSGEPKTEEKLAPKPEFKVPAGFGTPQHFKGPDAKLNAYKSGQFMLATMGNVKALQWCKDHGVEVLSQTEGTNTAGGYFVPPELATAIIDLRETYGIFRRNSQVVPMSSDTLTVNRRSSGLTAYWTGEEEAYTDSSAAWNQISLTAKKLTALTYWSNELNDDALISLMDKLAGEMAWAFALKEDQCGFVGDGTSTYSGIYGVMGRFASGSYAGSVAQAATGHTAYSTLTLSDFHSAVGKLPLYARPRARWYCSAVAFANSMERLMYAGGGNTTSTIGGGSGPSFLGYPVEISQVMNTTTGAQTSAYVLFFGDLSLAATMGVRRDITVDTSNQVKWLTDQMAIKASQRFDINVHDTGDSSNAGPVVALQMAAS